MQRPDLAPNTAQPSLNAIRTFVHAVRAGSFSTAASTLHVTQGAVSQQIARLEDYLGVRLFDRTPAGLKPTAAGQRLFFTVSTNVDQIDLAVTNVRSSALLETLVITTLSSFAVQWLLPRLAAFERRYPDIRIALETSTVSMDLRDSGIDAGIRCGRGDWSGLNVELLFNDVVFPVTTPEFAATLTGHDEPATIATLPLLYDLDTRAEWTDWFLAAGVQTPPNLFYGYSDTLVMLSALKNGKPGIALTHASLVRGEIDAGNLVRLFDHSVPARWAYWLVQPADVTPRDAFAAFRQWLLDEAAAYAVDARSGGLNPG